MTNKNRLILLEKIKSGLEAGRDELLLIRELVENPSYIEPRKSRPPSLPMACPRRKAASSVESLLCHFVPSEQKPSLRPIRKIDSTPTPTVEDEDDDEYENEAPNKRGQLSYPAITKGTR
jgi:hypothetical protein